MNVRRVCILGNGVAGITAAAELRKRVPDPSALEITVITRERYDYYTRIRLPETFDTGTSLQDITVYPPEWYEARAIKVVRDIEITGLDRAGHALSAADGSRFEYDVLILATGADPSMPMIPGTSLPGVITVRTYDDAMTIRDWAGKNVGGIAVIGGGLLGLETARHLAGSGKVTVLEIAPRLLPRQLDETGAEVLEHGLRRLGMNFMTGAEVARLDGRDRVESVELRDGRRIRAGTVVICMGIKPRVSLARKAGIAVDRGITVDEYLRTSDPDIYAAGDAAEYDGTVQGIVPAAMEQARAAAANILSAESVRYRFSAPRTTLKAAGISLTSIGNVTGNLPESSVFTILDRDRGLYDKIVLENGVMTGAILLGSTANLAQVSAGMGKPVDRATLENSLKIPEGTVSGWSDGVPEFTEIRS